MPYDYNSEKKEVFTENGQEMFLKIRDRVQKLLKESGSFTMGAAIRGCCGDTWVMLACVDRLVEINEIREIDNGQCIGQDRIFVRF